MSNNAIKLSPCDPFEAAFRISNLFFPLIASCQTDNEKKEDAETSSWNFDELGSLCVFPFKYGGKTYTSCTEANHDRPWCATEVWKSKNMKKWGHCNGDTCPVGK